MQLLYCLCFLLCAAYAQNLGYASCFGNYPSVLGPSSVVSSGIGSFIAGEDWTYTTAMCSPKAQTLAGSCWKVVCSSGKTGGMACKAGTSVNVRVIDQLGNACGGNTYSNHVFDLNNVAFDRIASDGASCSGEFYLNYSPVNCQTAGLVSGGIKIGIAPSQSDPWCPAFVFSNVGDSGALYSVSVSTNGGSTWNAFTRNGGNGARWDCNGGKGTYLQKSLSFKLVSCASSGLPGNCVAGTTLTLTNVLPSGWCVGGASPCGATSFQASSNFGVVINTPPPSTPPTTTPTTPPVTAATDKTKRCGTSWATANSQCGTLCPGGVNTQCPSGQFCFADLATTPCGSTPPPATPTPTPAPTTDKTKRCGTSWATANSQCGTLCPGGVNTQCPSGQFCFADLATTPCGSTPPPPATPTPTPPAPTPTPAASSVVGIWRWTWGPQPTFPSGLNLAIAFSGQIAPSLALADSASTLASLPSGSKKYLSLGGGNAVGHWTAAALSSIVTAINNNAFSAWDGLAFDIEEGDAGLSSAFASAFAATKAKGKGVLVTISHAAPYGVTDAQALTLSIISNTNVDYISPQLYTTGTESANDFGENMGIVWTDYANSKRKGRFIPSIVTASLYSSAQTYFNSKGVTCTGFIQWAQGGGSTTPPTTPPAGSNTVRCGTSWADANGRCGRPCPSGTNADCLNGETCWNALSSCTTTTPPPTTPPPTGAAKDKRCGTNWNDANGRCGTLCPGGTDAPCPSGQACFGSLDVTKCPASASVGEVSEETSNTGSFSQIPSWGIALVALAAVIVVLLLAVVLLLVKRR